ncbi:MAG: hypothetical protein II200_03510 [Bacteroidaceae bacterium]|nr:hypothetical protein [Bacteroidaceae bacterium]
MKKIYVAPKAEIVKMEASSMLAASSIKMYDQTVETSEEGVQLTRKENGYWSHEW